MAKPPPPRLAKLGITQVRDNLAPGQEVDVAKIFARDFGRALAKRLLSVKTGDKPCENAVPRGSLP